MPAKSSSRPPRTVRRLAALILATLAIAAAGVAAVLSRPDVLPGTGVVPPWPMVVAAGLVAVLTATLLRARRGRRLRRERTQDALARFDGLHVCGVIRSRPAEAAPGPERVLRLQVRSLEQALEGQDERIAEAARDGQRHALLTVSALREAVAGQPGELALSRVEAALRRIGAAPSFTRPALGAGHTGSGVVLPAPRPLVVTAEPAATAGPVVETETSRPVPAEQPVVAVESVVHPTPEPPVVRPVPAFTPRPVPHRTRRRFRRTVAA